MSDGAMHPFLVVGNLKMNLSSEKDGEHYLSELRKAAYGKHFHHAAGVIAPPYVQLSRFSHLPAHFSLGAQDMHWEKSGAHTGSISPVMLKQTGVTTVILGHSERRRDFGETDAIVRRKVEAALQNGLVPIVCVGESETERQAGDTTDVVGRQLEAVYGGLSNMQAEKIIVAYEPVWAISSSGTGAIPTTTEIFQVKVFLRKWFTERFSAALADRIGVLYGGSVNTANLGSVSWEAEMDGVLVGKESLFPRELVKMMELVEQHFKD